MLTAFLMCKCLFFSISLPKIQFPRGKYCPGLPHVRLRAAAKLDLVPSSNASSLRCTIILFVEVLCFISEYFLTIQAVTKHTH